MPINDTDLFLIETPAGDSKKIRASKLRDNISSYDNHKLLVNLADYSSRFVLAQNMLDRVQDNHWMLVERGGVSYKVSGAQVQEYFPYDPGTDITSWTWKDFTPSDAGTQGLNHITYGKGKFAATTGNSPKLLYSTDGLNWTASPSTIENTNWEGIAYGAGTFVTVTPDRGSAKQVMTSPDGINWTARSTPGDVGWVDVAFGDGKFVAVARTSGSSDTLKRIMYSTDGITWTQANNPSGANFQFYSVTFGQGKFVAVGHTSISTYGVITSPDGVNWTNVPESNIPQGQWLSVGFGAEDNTFAVMGTGNNTVTNKTMYSTNGTNWSVGDLSAVNPANTNSYHDVVGGSGLFVASNNTSTGEPIQSENGITWASIPNFPSQWNGIGKGVGYGAGKYVISSLTGVAVSTPL